MFTDSTLQVFEDLNASGAPSARRGFFHILRISNDLRQVRKRGFLLSRLFFWTFRKKLKADPEKTQAIFPENSSKFVKKLKNLPTKSQFFLNFFSFV